MKFELRAYEITSLNPGFVVIRVPGEPGDCHFELPPEEWKRLKSLGYCGGLIINEDTEIESLDEKLMNDLGWYRK